MNIGHCAKYGRNGEMRMFGTLFWGLLFIALGAAFLIKYVFQLNISVFRVIFGFVLIYFGISSIVGGFTTSTKNDVIFGKGNIQASKADNEYNMIFSNGEIDLRNVKIQDSNNNIEVHVVFSNGTVRLNPDVAAVVKVTSAFGTASVPGNSVSFGEYTYKTRGYREGEPYLNIDANVVFGKLDITE